MSSWVVRSTKEESAPEQAYNTHTHTHANINTQIANLGSALLSWFNQINQIFSVGWNQEIGSKKITGEVQSLVQRSLLGS